MRDNNKIKEAIEHAINNEKFNDTNSSLVDLVREFFNKNNIHYDTFSYNDIKKIHRRIE